MMRNRHILWAVFAVLVLASNCMAQPFFLRKDIPVGPQPVAVIPGDFNADGRPDLAVGTDEGIAVFLPPALLHPSPLASVGSVWKSATAPGTGRLAPLLYVSATQINFQVPAETAIGEATLAIVGDSGSTEAGSMQVNTVAPGFFMISAGSSHLRLRECF